MSSPQPTGTGDPRGVAGVTRRISTETKASYKTTELVFYLLTAIAVLIAAAVTDASDFGAQEAWWYVTLLTIGYMLSRGLAKSGSREPFDDRVAGRDDHASGRAY